MKEGKFNKWFCIIFLILIYGVVTFLGHENILSSIGVFILIVILINLPQSKFAPKNSTLPYQLQ